VFENEESAKNAELINMPKLQSQIMYRHTFECHLKFEACDLSHILIAKDTSSGFPSSYRLNIIYK